MFGFSIWLGFAVSAIYIYYLNERLKALTARVAFLEDRSPQAEYLRELEDAEKGWN